MNIEGETPSEATHATQFITLLTSHQSRLYSYIATMMLDDAAAVDVLQETNLNLWAHAHEFDLARPFMPWASVFARNRVLAFRKANSRSRLVFTDEAIDLIHDKFLESADELDDRLAALQKCLSKLSPQQADLIHERYVANASIKAMAGRLSDTAHNISSRLHRIRKILAKCVECTLATQGQ